MEPGGGGIGGKCPFSGMKVPYFHGIEVPLFQKCSEKRMYRVRFFGKF